MERSLEMEDHLASFIQQKTELEEKVSKMEREKEEAIEQEDFRSKYEALFAMVEPFKDQLEDYEAEKAALIRQNTVTAEKMKDLAAQYGKV